MRASTAAPGPRRRPRGEGELRATTAAPGPRRRPAADPARAARPKTTARGRPLSTADGWRPPCTFGTTPRFVTRPAEGPEPVVSVPDRKFSGLARFQRAPRSLTPFEAKGASPGPGCYDMPSLIFPSVADTEAPADFARPSTVSARQHPSVVVVEGSSLDAHTTAHAPAPEDVSRPWDGRRCQTEDDRRQEAADWSLMVTRREEEQDMEQLYDVQNLELFEPQSAAPWQQLNQVPDVKFHRLERVTTFQSCDPREERRAAREAELAAAQGRRRSSLSLGFAAKRPRRRPPLPVGPVKMAPRRPVGRPGRGGPGRPGRGRPGRGRPGAGRPGRRRGSVASSASSSTAASASSASSSSSEDQGAAAAPPPKLPLSSGATLPKSSGATLPKSSGATLPKASGATLPKASGASLPKASPGAAVPGAG